MRLLLPFLLLISCGEIRSPYYSHNFYDQFPPPYAYTFRRTATTPRGVSVDSSGLAIDLEEIDRRIDNAEECLTLAFGIPPVIPADVRAASACDADTFPLPLLRQDLRVKVASDWIPSCDGTEELLPAPSPDSGCEAKGLVPTDLCPCHWRAGIQNNAFIVITPDLYLLKDPAVRMATGCNDVWSAPLAACVAP